MNRAFQIGPRIFAAAVLFFGIQQFIFLAWPAGPIPGPPWLSGGTLWACSLGILLVGCGLSIAFEIRARWAAASLAIVLLLRAMVLYLPGVFASPRRPGNWTSAFELLAMAGASLVLMNLSRRPSASESGWKVPGRVGQILVAGSLVVFGVQHFIYARFIATLVPSWIPAKLFWAYFVGVAFVGAATSILVRRITRLATGLLGTMFLLWFFILHLPRVVVAAKNGNEWTSAFVALAMGGSALILGRAESGRVDVSAA
jgi:uncharacterized membrane protein